jgi:hypothetical protein
MKKRDLIFASGTSTRMQVLAESLPAEGLFLSYQAGCKQFNTRDIVLVMAGPNSEVLLAANRMAYVDRAFRQWNAVQREAHPLAKEPAYKRLQMPADTPAFWLVVEMQENEMIVCCAIGLVEYTGMEPN